jgi:uncharacterized protein YgiB involved in biofilm formation
MAHRGRLSTVWKSLRLALAALAGAVLAACGQGPPDTAMFYKDVPSCAARLGDERCVEAYGAAMREHVGQAPVALLKGECEVQFGRGNCEGRMMPSNRPYYVPAMMGFVTDGRYSAPVYSEYDGTALVLRGANVYHLGQFVLPRQAAGRPQGRRAVSASPRDYTEFRQMPAVRVSGNGFDLN